MSANSQHAQSVRHIYQPQISYSNLSALRKDEPAKKSKGNKRFIQIPGFSIQSLSKSGAKHQRDNSDIIRTKGIEIIADAEQHQKQNDYSQITVSKFAS